MVRRINLLFIAFSVLSSSSWAQEIDLKAGTNRALVLRGKTCEEVTTQQKAICEWKKIVEPGFEPKNPVTCKTVNGKAQVTILECLPKFTKDYHLKTLANSGPNCWGTTMNLKGMSLAPRFMWPEEMEYWIDSPLCRKLSPGEEKKPGDVMNVYGPEYIFDREINLSDMGTRFWDALYPGRYQEPKGVGYSGYHRLLHSVTYITDEIAFGKDSPAHDDKFKYHNASEIYGRPSYDRECTENQNLTPHRREYDSQPKTIAHSKCAYFSTLHRCERFDDYFGSLPLTDEEKDIFKNVEALQKIQETLFPLVTTPKTVLPSSAVNLIVTNADLTMKRCQEDLSKKGLSKNREMLLTLEYFTAAALRKSLEQARIIPATEAL